MNLRGEGNPDALRGRIAKSRRIAQIQDSDRRASHATPTPATCARPRPWPARVGDLGLEARARGEAEATTGGAGLMRGFVVLWQDRLLRTLTLALVAIAAIYLPTESIVLTAYFEKLGEPASLGIVISTLAVGATLGAFGYG